jgi:transcriptional regulator with XRE-family HTH domain
MSLSQPDLTSLRPSVLADAIGCSGPYASQLLRGIRTPSLSVAVKIERAFGIPPSAWLEPRPERAA